MRLGVGTRSAEHEHVLFICNSMGESCLGGRQEVEQSEEERGYLWRSFTTTVIPLQLQLQSDTSRCCQPPVDNKTEVVF